MTTCTSFRRELRAWYAPTRTPGVVDVPRMAFVMVDGHGETVIRQRMR